MKLSTVMQASLNNLLHHSINLEAITSNADSFNKLAKICYPHFCFPTQTLLPAHRQSYKHTLTALRLSLNPPLMSLQNQAIKGFQHSIKQLVLPKFPHKTAYKHLAKECALLEQHVLFAHESEQAISKQTFENDLAHIIAARQLPNLSQLILDDVQHQFEISPELLQLLQLQDLLTQGMWHFLQADIQLSKFITHLQQEQTFQRVMRIEKKLHDILSWVRDIHRRAEHAMNNYADHASLHALEQAQQHLAEHHSCLSHLTQAFQNGDPEKARDLMHTALQHANNDAEQALVHYSLFKLVLAEREPDLARAFAHLQQAIQLDEAHYAPCDPLSFKLKALLGVGGMGYALLAESAESGAGSEQVVIKCFWQNLQHQQLAEAIKMRQIAEEYVPRLFGAGVYQHHGRLCLVTHYLPEAIDGARWLHEHGKLADDVGLVIAIRLAEALQVMHSMGVLHLDLKPANLLLIPAAQPEAWQIRIIDFGLSKLLPRWGEGFNSHSLTGTVSLHIAASFEYASPEQKAGLKTDTPSDVYSYGKTMLDLLGDINGFDIPAPLQKTLAKCLKAKPEERINLQDLLLKLINLEDQEFDAAREEVARLQREQTALEQQAQLIKAREELEQQRLEQAQALQTEQACLARERAVLAQQRYEHQQIIKAEQAHLEQVRANLEQLHEVQKGTARSFSTVQAGRVETFTVYEKTVEINAVPFEMVYVPAGEFMMGSEGGYSEESPAHLVNIRRAFYMGKFPITQAQYQAVMGNNPSRFKGENLPVEQVNWFDAQEFCKQLSQLLGKTCRLPTEAEREYCCRAGTDTKYWWGNSIDARHCWYVENADNKTHAVDEKLAEHSNPFGLCDMSGHIWEWTCSEHAPYGDGKEMQCYQAPAQEIGIMRVLRGGSWYDTPDDIRTTLRNYSDPTDRYFFIGFRVVMFEI
ncbi:MAG: hypothetical protein RL368_1178 [Pseudomonadota bacterium]|jgi:formylglycine-generating enzyme required for sulfatase activity